MKVGERQGEAKNEHKLKKENIDVLIRERKGQIYNYRKYVVIKVRKKVLHKKEKC